LVRNGIRTCYGHRLGGISVEGGLGTVSGTEVQVKVSEEEAQLCDPSHAAPLAFCGKWPYFTLNKYCSKLEAAAKGSRKY
jgi:hypothetical protein